MLYVVSLYHIGVGQWAQAKESLEQATEMFGRSAQLGLQPDEPVLYRWLSRPIWASGRNGRPALHGGARQRTSGASGLGVGRSGDGDAAFGQIEQAARALNTALSLYASVSASALGETAIQGTLAVLCLRQGQSQLARQAAETTARLLAKTSFPFYSLIDGYTAVADVYLALWEEDLFPASTTSQTQANSPMGALARPACRALHRFARIYPIGQPHAWLCQGLYDWLDGQPAQARNAWRKSLAHAERLAMPYDEGQAHYELGRHASGDERKPHLTRAAEIFERLGAAYDLERTQMAMNAMA